MCTIHQPSIDIFEAFDELVLLKRGGETIFCGSLGEHSKDLIAYFSAIRGVPPAKEVKSPTHPTFKASCLQAFCRNTWVPLHGRGKGSLQ